MRTTTGLPYLSWRRAKQLARRPDALVRAEAAAMRAEHAAYLAELNVVKARMVRAIEMQRRGRR